MQYDYCVEPISQLVCAIGCFTVLNAALVFPEKGMFNVKLFVTFFNTFIYLFSQVVFRCMELVFMLFD
jgi:hypothetical protein